MFLVVDTNIVVSALLFPRSLPSRAINTGLTKLRLAVTIKVHTEYLEVFARKKFDPYVSLEQRMLLLENF